MRIWRREGSIWEAMSLLVVVQYNMSSSGLVDAHAMVMSGLALSLSSNAMVMSSFVFLYHIDTTCHK